MRGGFLQNNYVNADKKIISKITVVLYVTSFSLEATPSAEAAGNYEAHCSEVGDSRFLRNVFNEAPRRNLHNH